MNIKVLIADSAEAKSISAGAFVVEQANERPIQCQKSFGLVSGKRVMALVPAFVPNSKSQSPAILHAGLASCYEHCIMSAVLAGASTIVVKPLGVGKRINEVFENGQLIDHDIWGDLFWTQAKTSMAAKSAVQNAVSRADFPEDVNVIFIVPKEAFDDWDSAMQFSC